jgi:hypothetical protein
MDIHTDFNCAVDQQLMQSWPAQCKSRAAWKFGARGRFFVLKTNPNERKSVACVQMDTELAKGRNSVWQDSFAARLINRGLSLVQNHAPESNLACSNSRRNPCGSCSYNDNTLAGSHGGVEFSVIRC